MKAPEYIVKATLDTLHLAMIFCRNFSLTETDMDCVADLMDALHEVPNILFRWDDKAIDEIQLHFSCFDYSKWKGAPNLLEHFENKLDCYASSI